MPEEGGSVFFGACSAGTAGAAAATEAAVLLLSAVVAGATLDSAPAVLAEAAGDFVSGEIPSVDLASVDPVFAERGVSAVVSELFVDSGGGGVPKSSANDFQ